MCFVAVFGILLMIIINEIIFRNLHNKYPTFVWVMQLTITISTVVLLIQIVTYHFFDLKLIAVNQSLHSWYIGLTTRKLTIIMTELCICSIHPFPSYLPLDNNLPSTQQIPSARLNIILGLPSMYWTINLWWTLVWRIHRTLVFLRLYLLTRFLMYRSHLVKSISSQSFGVLNEISINIMFLLRTYVDRWPVRCVGTFCILFFFMGSWLLHACSYDTNGTQLVLLDAMWLFIVTFATVG